MCGAIEAAFVFRDLLDMVCDECLILTAISSRFFAHGVCMLCVFSLWCVSGTLMKVSCSNVCGNYTWVHILQGQARAGPASA